MKKGALITLIVTLVIFLVSLTASIILLINSADDFIKNETVTETVEVSGSDSVKLKNQSVIKLENIFFQVNVKKATGDEVKAELNGTYAGKVAPELSVKSNSDKITIAIDKKDVVLSWFGSSNTTNHMVLDVYIPTSYNGDFQIEDCAGAVNAEFDFENVEIEDCAGKIDVKGAYDTVKIKDCAGAVTAETTNSDFDSISVKDCAGKITLVVPKNAKGTISAEDCLGSVKSDFPLSKEKDEMFDYSGEMNGGGSAEISIKDCTGSVNIGKAE